MTWSPTINPDSFVENWSTISLSLRDLRRDVPINYNQYPGIVLTPACFSDKRYTDDKAACVANLIAIGYRRFVVDLYLNTNNGGWSICPATSPIQSLALSSNVSETPPIDSTGSSIPSSETQGANLLARQTSTLPPATSTDFLDATIIDSALIGQYTCDDTFNATTLLSIFDSWMTGTNTDLRARILLLDFNLHETIPTSNSSNISAESLSQTLKSANVLADAYTPDKLLADRADLNSSWFGEMANINSSKYFITQDNGETMSTGDGWPSEAYLEFEVKKRVLASFGTIEAGLSYDPVATGDENNIFPSGYLGNLVVFNSSSSPKCFFSPSDTELKDVNSSWAQVVDTASDSFSENVPGVVTNLTKCGYSTLYNPTNSSNLTQTEDFAQYANHIKAAFSWAWDANEPANTTGKDETFRCASMSAKDGRWMVSDCGERKLAACRIQDNPYNWKLTSRDGTYYDSTGTCSSDTGTAIFDAPRNALENQYLFAAIKDAKISQDHYIWLDFNSLAVESCWVTGGANASCPYDPTDPGNREVIVSAVAAVIVLIVFGLMLFAKVGSWRVERSHRKRRRMLKKRNLEGVEYEGVPS